MNTLIQNITNIYGDKGLEWLDNLPRTIEILIDYWQLKNVLPVPNMTYNYVAKATTRADHAVVLKISCDKNTIDDERQALKYFAGQGSIELIDYHNSYHAMLLHQAVPGVTLKSLYLTNVEYVIKNYLIVVQKLHTNKYDGKYQFNHISDWLKAIDNCTSVLMPQHLKNKALHLKNELLVSAENQVLMHGDLHHDNILKDTDQWLAIDPKGIIGEPEFEVAAFDFIHESEIKPCHGIYRLFEERIKFISQNSHFNIKRIKQWVFIRLILAAAWCIEDNNDPTRYITLAEKLFLM